MSDGFELKFDFVERWGRVAKAEYLQVYIYLLCCMKKSGRMLSAAETAKQLHVTEDSVSAAMDFWITAGLIEDDGGGGYRFSEEKGAGKKTRRGSDKSGRLRSRPSYDAAEIDAAASVNGDVDYMFRQAEKILGRLLSPSDFEMLYSFVDWLGLPVEVVIMLLNFAAGQGKTTKRYLETVAIDWADRGIDTYESAEEYIKEIEEKMSNEGKIRGVLGIYDRALTQTEKKYIKAWTYEKDIPLALIGEAYDRTVAATGKLSWAYMNKILMSWCDEGIKTVEEVAEREALHKLKSGAVRERSGTAKKKTRGINNYEDTNRPDYSDFAKKILDDMLDEE